MTINAIQKAKLMVVAKVGELMPRGKRGPKTEEQVSSGTPTKLFHRETTAKYRKVADNKEAIDDYYEAVEEDGHEEENGLHSRTANGPWEKQRSSRRRGFILACSGG